MYAITRRLDVLAPVLIDCNYSGGEPPRTRERNVRWGLHLLLRTPSSTV